MKLIDARKDHYRKLAHDEGYRSRASYKLKELNKSYRIIGAGHFVLDLGCAPGGWMQVAAKIVGNKGKVMGIDRSYVEEIPHTFILKASINDDNIVKDIFDFFVKKVNTVICDLSPQVTGNWSVDHASQISLNYSAVKITEQVLKKKAIHFLKFLTVNFQTNFITM